MLSCVGIIGGFILLPILFGDKENYEVKNTMPVLPIENEVLMRGDEITREDVTEIIGHSNKKMKRTNTKASTLSTPSTMGLTSLEQKEAPSEKSTIIAYTKDGKAIVGYTEAGDPIIENIIKQPEHWSEIKRNGDSVSKQMGETKRQMVPIKTRANVRLDHGISNLDGSSTVICTLRSNSIGKLNGLTGATIKGTFYSIKDSNKMHLQFSKIISKKGKDISVSAYAISSDGSAGIPADVDNNIGNEVINFLTAQVVSSQTNDVSRIVLDKSIGQSELETQRKVSVQKGTRFTIYFDEPVFI